MTVTPNPCSLPARSAVVTAAIGRAVGQVRTPAVHRAPPDRSGHTPRQVFKMARMAMIRLGGSVEQQRDPHRPGSGPVADQQVRQAVRGFIEVAGRSDASVRRTWSAAASGCTRHMLGEQRGNRDGRGCWPDQRVAVAEGNEAGALAVTEQIEDDRRARVGSQWRSAPAATGRSTSRWSRRREHVGAEFHRPADTGRLTGLGPPLGQREIRHPFGRCGCPRADA